MLKARLPDSFGSAASTHPIGGEGAVEFDHTGK
jgi:hypothetical protein